MTNINIMVLFLKKNHSSSLMGQSLPLKIGDNFDVSQPMGRSRQSHVYGHDNHKEMTHLTAVKWGNSQCLTQSTGVVLINLTSTLFIN